jgi:hypothetical protein
LITTASLKTQSVKDLAEMAKSKGLPGWHSMRKDELVAALVRAAKKRSKVRASAAARKTVKSKKLARRVTRVTAVKPHPAHPKPAAAHVNGSKVNGTKVNGTKVNGTKVNGSRVNGSKVNGSKVNGTAKHAPAAPRNGIAAHAKRSVAPQPTPARPASLQLNPAQPNPAKSTPAKSTPAKPTPAQSSPAQSSPAQATPAQPTAKQARVTERIHRAMAERERLKDLSGTFRVSKSDNKRKEAEKDRLVLVVRDSYWLQAIWAVTRHSVKRAEAALAEHWHTAFPVLRLLEVDSGLTTSTAERVAREIDVHGGVTNWYIEVANPPQNFRAELGYKAANGRFYAICRSNIVRTPAPDSGDVIDENWTDVAENYERVYALSGGYAEDNQSGELQELFEERLRRPMGNASTGQFGSGAERMLNRHRELEFHVDAEMILYGRTRPDAKVTLSGEPIKIRPDGSFTVRQPLPDKRQVLPVVASTADGVEQRTIVIAVERNTKVLEPMVREHNE